MCHLLLLMPLLGLVVFWIWPFAIAGPVYAVIFGLSAWLYYFVLQAMRRPIEIGTEALLRSRGEVVDVGESMVQVRVRSETWQAESADDLHKGDRVEVTGVDGLTLIVRRLHA